MKEYKTIEGLPDWPFDIDIKENQTIIKDFLWRVAEELSESWEARIIHKDPLHYLEELSDALHFIVEIFKLTGTEIDKKKIPSLEEYFNTRHPFIGDRRDVKEYYHEIHYRLGLVGNVLKNKPWKQSQILTDKNKFYLCLNKVLVAFLDLCLRLDLTADDIYNLYIRKSIINEFRQRSKY